MNKHWFKFVLIGFILILISFVLTGFNYQKLIKPFKDNNEYTKKIHTSAKEELNNIEINSKNNNIKIIPTDADEIKITYYESEYNKISIIENNNVLIVTETIKHQIINININFFVKTITIEIPKEKIMTLDIKTSNGSININNLATNNTKLKTSNGKINTYNLTTNDLVLTTSNGSVDLKNTEANYINTKTSNGKIVLKQIKTNILTLKASNASINLTDVEANKKIDVKTSNGKIEFDNIISENIICETSNGRISGTIEDSETNYNQNLKTSNASITVNNDDYGKSYKRNNNVSKNISLKTSNGKIEITYTK